MLLSPMNPLFALVATALAFLAVWCINRKKLLVMEKGRYDSIDGLRGYLAFFVFLHHSYANYFYLTTDKWHTPSSNLYTIFGHGSVQIFFMITSFLFFGKLLHGDQRKIDWTKFYISRLLRLYPLYLFSMCLFFLIIAYLSMGDLRESYWELFKHTSSWLLMGVFGMAEVNEIQQTHQINAGVTWTLSYEWIFYLAMPTLAFLLRNKTTNFWLAFSLISVCVLAIFNPILGGKAFLGGIIASYLIRNDEFKLFAASNIASILVVISLFSAVVFFSYSESFALVLLMIAFILVACGNNLYGALIHPVSKALGNLSYSIYLLHGILLFVTFNILIDKPFVTSPIVYWGIILIITPILILICHYTYHYIEYPLMKSTDKVMIWLKKLGWRNAQKA